VSGVGVIAWAGAIDEPAIERFRAALKLRGRDRFGEHNAGPVHLFQAAFDTTPEATRERQPLVHSKLPVMLVADARLDNRAELLGHLQLPPIVTDADVLLAAYLRWDERLCEHLLGDFAFVIWDGRHQRLVAARDHLGIRPLYWQRTPRGLVVASSIRAIVDLGLTEFTVNKRYVGEVMIDRLNTGDETIWREILQMPNGHVMVFEQAREKATRYWDFSVETLDVGFDEAAALVRQAFDEAVSCRLRLPGHRVGCEFSGGFDSTTVAAVLNRHQTATGLEVMPLAMVFRGMNGCDEEREIDAAAKAIGLELRKVDGLKALPVALEKEARFAADVPIAGGDGAALLELLAQSDQEGGRVVFSGQGGDLVLASMLASVDTWNRLPLGQRLMPGRGIASIGSGLEPANLARVFLLRHCQGWSTAAGRGPLFRLASKVKNWRSARSLTRDYPALGESLKSSINPSEVLPRFCDLSRSGWTLSTYRRYAFAVNGFHRWVLT